MALSQAVLPKVVDCSPSSITLPVLPGAQIRSLEAHQVSRGYQSVIEGLYFNNPGVSSWSSKFCNVTVQYTPLGQDSRTTVQIWLPTDKWNGRMQALGGSGWAAGLVDMTFSAMAGAVIEGYTAISTDGGHADPDPKTWALLPNGEVNKQSLLHFAQTSLNDLSILGKAVAESFYGKPPSYSYFNGCSQGGRQGYQIAQSYPKAFDGIVASAAPLDWSQLTPAGFWAQAAMHETGEYPDPCELAALTDAAVKACDGKDGPAEGFVLDPDGCYFDPYTLVNTTVSCGIGQGTRKITRAASEVAHVGWTGRNASTHSYMKSLKTNYGAAFVTKGSVPYISDLLPFLNTTFGLADSVLQSNGTRRGKPFNVVSDWFRYFIEKNPNYDYENVRWKEFDRHFQLSVEEYNHIIGTNNTDLRPFAQAGGKLIGFHGLVSQVTIHSSTGFTNYLKADSVVPSLNTRFYYDGVLQKDKNAHDYYRHFEAPGVVHCYRGAGLYPQNIFRSL
jgi:hypothetical protein